MSDEEQFYEFHKYNTTNVTSSPPSYKFWPINNINRNIIIGIIIIGIIILFLYYYYIGII